MLFGLYRDHPSKSISLQRPSILFRPHISRRSANEPVQQEELVEPPGIAPGSDPPISARLSP